MSKESEPGSISKSDQTSSDASSANRAHETLQQQAAKDLSSPDFVNFTGRSIGKDILESDDGTAFKIEIHN